MLLHVAFCQSKVQQAEVSDVIAMNQSEQHHRETNPLRCYSVCVCVCVYSVHHNKTRDNVTGMMMSLKTDCAEFIETRAIYQLSE